jgi:hypothetical protein
MTPKFHLVLEQCIEVGITRGYNRAYKHNENPTPEHVQDCIHQCIMGELYEWFDFPPVQE